MSGEGCSRPAHGRWPTVLSGSLSRSGNRMRLAVRLISLSDGYHRWSERFDRELVDLFAVQGETSAAIAATLCVTFVSPAQPAGNATTAEVQAFELVAYFGDRAIVVWQ